MQMYVARQLLANRKDLLAKEADWGDFSGKSLASLRGGTRP